MLFRGHSATAKRFHTRDFGVEGTIKAIVRRYSSIRAAAGPPKASGNAFPTTPARTRFAPSPTGHLHLGSLRTALFNYLLAKKTGGQFLLRLEDTDQKRTVSGAESKLYEDLRWAGLHWDEGPEVGGPFGPYRQSERTKIYNHYASLLLNSGHAYRCFCSPGRLRELAEGRSKLGLSGEYDRKCASLSLADSDRRAVSGVPCVVRLRSPDYIPSFDDIVCGQIGGALSDKKQRASIGFYDDTVLLKSDGLPTYHLANVIDDHLMEITHVLRGTEWLSSTGKHIALYEAFNWKPPIFGHVSLLLKEDGNKLSKRSLDVNVTSFRDDMGVLPEALTNFVALMGWSHGAKSDVMTMKELIDAFSLRFTKRNAKVTMEKLSYLQRKHITKLAASADEKLLNALEQRINDEFSEADLQPILDSRHLRDYAAAVLRADAKNYIDPAEFMKRNAYFFSPVKPKEPAGENAVAVHLRLEELKLASEMFSQISSDNWGEMSLAEKVDELVASSDGVERDPTSSQMAFITHPVTKSSLHQQLRGVLAGGMPGPSMLETMAILGRMTTLKRLEEGITRIQST